MAAPTAIAKQVCRGVTSDNEDPFVISSSLKGYRFCFE